MSAGFEFQRATEKHFVNDKGVDGLASIVMFEVVLRKCTERCTKTCQGGREQYNNQEDGIELHCDWCYFG